MAAYPIIYENLERTEVIRGVALPLFIHNGGFHLVTLDIYDDGVADCWELVSIDDIGQKVDEGWITTEPPDGAEISINGLGRARALDARWIIPNHQLAQTAHDLFNTLDAEGRPRLDLGARRKKFAAEDNVPEDRIWLTRLRAEDSVFRLTAEGKQVRGSNVPLFHGEGGEYTLANCFVFQDHMARIGEQGTLRPVDDVKVMLDNGSLLTSIPDGSWVNLEGLGRFRVMEGSWYIDPHERWREILNLIDILNGGEDCVEECYQAFLAYQIDPNGANLEHLRRAYEAVPEHQRIYTQRSMDNKDHDIRRILSGS